jgi:hypothetical protein
MCVRVRNARRVDPVGYKSLLCMMFRPTGKNVRLVNDTEIDVSGTFSAPGGYAFFDVTVFEGPGPLNSSIPQAVCNGCLNIDAGP